MAKFHRGGRSAGGLWSTSQPLRKQLKRSSRCAQLPDHPRCDLGWRHCHSGGGRSADLGSVACQTAPSPESEVRRFIMRTLGQFGWQFGPGNSTHELRLQREDIGLRGFLRLGQPEFGKAGTGVTLGIRDPRRRQNGCLKALPWLPIYPGAEVRSCDLVHIPGARSLSVLAATSDDVELANQTLGRALLAAGLTSQPPVIGTLVFRHQSGAREMVRVIWGPDPTGHLPTAFMLSIDLPEAALTELPQ